MTELLRRAKIKTGAPRCRDLVRIPAIRAPAGRLHPQFSRKALIIRLVSNPTPRSPVPGIRRSVGKPLRHQRRETAGERQRLLMGETAEHDMGHDLELAAHRHRDMRM